MTTFIARMRPATVIGIILLLAVTFIKGNAASSPAINVAPTSGLPGTTVLVSASGFIAHASQSVEIFWDTEGNSVGKIFLDKNGDGSGTFTVPADAAVGGHTVLVCAGCGNLDEERARATFEIIAPPPPPQVDTPTNTKQPGIPNTPTFTPTFTATFTPTATPTLQPFIMNIAPAEALFNNPNSPLGIVTSRLPVEGPCRSLSLSPDAYVITFDDRPSGELTNAYPDRVTFPAASAYIAAHPILAHSGSQVLTGLFTDMGGINHPIVMNFPNSLSGLGMFVGREEPSEYASESIVAVLTAYGQDPAGHVGVVGRAEVELPAHSTPIDRCLVIRPADGTFITSAVLDFLNSTGHSVYDRRLVDDLTLEMNYARPTATAPVVDIVSPTNGSTQTSEAAYLRVDITEEHELSFVKYYLDGDTTGQVVNFTRDALNPQLYHASITILSGITPNTTHQVRVQAGDIDTLRGEDSVRFNYQPESGVDIVLDAIELTQATQFMFTPGTADNFMPLITNKPTLVRVYAHMISGPYSLSGISGILCRGVTGAGGCTSPVRPIAPVILRRSDDLVALRDDIYATLNFLLPADWLVAGDSLRLTAYINYQEENAAECCLDNNLLHAGADVVAGNTMNVGIFKMIVNDRIAPDIGANVIDGLRSVYPISHINYYDLGYMPIDEAIDFYDRSHDNGWDLILDTLDNYRLLGPAIPDNTHLYGLVESSAVGGAWGGMGRRPGYVSGGFANTGDIAGSSSVAAEEIGHNHGRKHASASRGAENPDPSYPNTTGKLDQVGIDVRYPNSLYRTTAGDYMSYNTPHSSRWTSAYTYEAMWLAICSVAYDPLSAPHAVAAPLAQALPEEYLVGGGRISPEGLGRVDPLFRFSSSKRLTDSLPAGPYTVELRDQGGAALLSRGFGVPEIAEIPVSDSGNFQFIVPWVEGTRSVAFIYNGAVIGSLEASPNPPAVTLLVPNGGENWAAQGTQTVSWQASDPDEDALTFAVQYTCNEGQTWTPLAARTQETSLNVDVSALPGGGACRVRVLASDGFHTASDSSDGTFASALKPPEVTIINPQEHADLPPGWPVILSVVATDAEDGSLPVGSLSWSSDVDGALGSGEFLAASVQNMTAGRHVITLTGKDSDGLTVTAMTKIELVPPPAAAVNPNAQASSGTSQNLLPLLIGAVVLLAAAVLVAVLVRRKKAS